MSTDLLHLGHLATRINEEHAKCEVAARTAIDHAIKVGRLLLEAKDQVAHGEWGEWVEKHCAFSQRSAQGYMRVARRAPELGGNAQRVAPLSLRQGLALISEPKDQGPESETDLWWQAHGLAKGRLAELEAKLGTASSAEEFACIAIEALRWQNLWAREKLWAERMAGRLLKDLKVEGPGRRNRSRGVTP